MNGDIEMLAHFNRTRLHNASAKPSHFKHFIIGNFLHAARVRLYARVGRINAVHIRVYLAAIGFECSGKRNG